MDFFILDPWENGRYKTTDTLWTTPEQHFHKNELNIQTSKMWETFRKHVLRTPLHAMSENQIQRMSLTSNMWKTFRKQSLWTPLHPMSVFFAKHKLDIQRVDHVSKKNFCGPLYIQYLKQIQTKQG